MDVSRFRPHAPGTQPPLDTPAYLNTARRHPHQGAVPLPGGHTPTELTGPRLHPARHPALTDLTRTGANPALGERIIVAGRVLDEDGRAVPNTMIEIWQANAAGRYAQGQDQHDAPLDPNFRGSGRVFSDQDGAYRFTTVKPGAYPWPNHHNAWRPNHIHFSVFGAGFAQRLVTQMYFPGDPLLALDPIFNAIPDTAARHRLVAAFDIAVTEPEHALGYRFDVVLRGRDATRFEAGAHEPRAHA